MKPIYWQVLSNALYVDGDWPPMMKYATEKRRDGSKILPEFTQTEKDMILGSSDFFGLNHYTSKYHSPKYRVLKICDT